MRINRSFCALLALIVVAAALGQSPVAYRIDDIVPAGDVGDGGPATEALLALAQRITFDSEGCLYISDTRHHRVRKVERNGTIRTLAGTGDPGFSGDNGPATQALVNFPLGLGVDQTGNVYFADSNNQRVRMISAATGVITTVAGTGEFGFSGDGGPGTSAQLASPAGLAVGTDGTVYIADRRNNRIRALSPSSMGVAQASGKTITTFAGTGEPGAPTGDGGPATAARVPDPVDLFVAADGSIVVSSFTARSVRAVSPDGIIETVFDGTQVPNFGLTFGGVAVAGNGDLFVSDGNNNRVLRISAGVPSAFAGTGELGFNGDGGLAVESQLGFPNGLAFNSVGELHIADVGNQRIRKVDAEGRMTTAVGRDRKIGDRSAADGEMLIPVGIHVAPDDSVLISQANGNVVDRLTSNTSPANQGPGAPRLTTVAGNQRQGFSGDGGLATEAKLSTPVGMFEDSNGTVYFTEFSNNLVRQVSNGTITTAVGGGLSNTANGPVAALDVMLVGPEGVIKTAAGELLIGESTASRVREVASGMVRDVVSVGRGRGFSGDGGPATQAQLNGPAALALDGDGGYLISDSRNNVIRQVNAAGVINTVVGSENSGFRGDGGPPTQARLSVPAGLGLAANGDLFFADSGNRRIRVVRNFAAALKAEGPAQGVGAVIETIAGDGTALFTGGGGLASMTGFSPFGLGVDSNGAVYFADQVANRVFKLTPVSVQFTSASLANAASFQSGPAAPAMIGSLFGMGLADAFIQIDQLPLPTTAGGSILEVTDSTGTTRPSALFFVAGTQVNFEVPPGTALGPATLTVQRGGDDFLSAPIEIRAVAPGLFAANARGSGVAAAFSLRIAADGTRTQELIFDTGLSAAPVDLGPEGDQVFLLLFGTGVRGFSTLTVTVGGENVGVLGALPQGEFVGLDQVNIGPLPRSLAGRGEVEIVLTADGVRANTVTVSIQ